MNSPTVAEPSSKGSKKLILAAAFIAVAFVALLAVSFIGISDDSDATVTTYSDLGDLFSTHDIQAEYDDTTFTLTFSYIGAGTGASMKSFGKDDYKAPWREDGNNEEIEEIIIGPKIFDIGYCAFYDCKKVESVTIGSDVVRISGLAFGRCSALEEIEIPASVTSIDTSDTPSFAMCTSLNKYIVAAENESFSAENGILFNKDKTELYGYPFAKTDLTEYTIPDSVKKIDGYAFYGSKLEQINFGSNVEYIGYAAFSNCTLITGLDLPDSLTEIYNHAFDGCSSLISITIPKNVGVIEWFAFYGCSSLSSVTVADGNKCFSVIEGVLYKNDTDTGKVCELVLYPAMKTGSTELYVPSGVTIVAPYAFMDSTVTAVDLPATVEAIYDGVFTNCDDMTELYVHATTVPELGKDAFKNVSNVPDILVPYSAHPTYISYMNWSDYASNIVRAVETPVAESIVYNGTEQSGVKAITDVISVTGTGSAVNAGKYTATVSLVNSSMYRWFDGTTEPKSVDWKIDKCKPSSSLFDYTAPSNLVYDGGAKTAQVTVKSSVVGMGALTVKYSDNVHVGTCKVTASVEEGQNYLAGDCEVGSFTITEQPSNNTTLYIVAGVIVAIIVLAGVGVFLLKRKK